MKHFLLFVLVLMSPQAWASDPSGLIAYFYLFSLIIASLVSGLVWVIGKMIGMTPKVKFFMVLPYAVLVTPVPLFSQGIALPSLFVLLGGALFEKGVALIAAAFSLLAYYGFKAQFAKIEDMEMTEQLQSEERIRQAEAASQIEAIKEKTKGLR